MSAERSARRVASNTAVQVAGKGVVLAIGAVSIAVLTRYLGPGDYGRYTLALMYMQLLRRCWPTWACSRPSCATSAASPARTEELVGNTLTLRLVLSLVRDRAGRRDQPGAALRARRARGDLLAGGPLLFGHARQLARSPCCRRGCGWAGRWPRTSPAARSRSALVGWWPWLDLGFYAVMGAAAGGALVTLVVTWLLTRRIAAVRLPGATWRCGGACCVAALPLGLALAINELYFRADTLIISLYEPYEEVGLYTLAYRILEFTLVARHDLPDHASSRCCPTPWPATSRARCRTIQRSSDLFVVLGVPLVAGGLDAGAGAGRAGRRRRTSTARRRRCGSCWPPARWPGSTACSASR